MALDCSDSSVLPVVFDATLSGTANVLTQVTLPRDVANLRIEIQFAATGGYVTYTGTDNAAVGAAVKDSAFPVASTWYPLPRITNPALLFLGSANISAVAKVRISARG